MTRVELLTALTGTMLFSSAAARPALQRPELDGVLKYPESDAPSSKVNAK